MVLVSSNVLTVVVDLVVVWWWWRLGGVWRGGCHWLHIHVPPSLVPTILHHPGHQIILHQTILHQAPYCTTQVTKPPASAVTNHLGHTIFQSQPQIIEAIINMPPLIPAGCFADATTYKSLNSCFARTLKRPLTVVSSVLSREDLL